MKHPQKRNFRSRAHCNPLSHNDGFHYPVKPTLMSWEAHYPNIPINDRIVRFLDIGMGYGGMSIGLASKFPDKLVLGMEIRPKVCEYVRLKIEALRSENPGTLLYQNAACLRTNCMRYLPNYFGKGQIEKIFICFPDPHFKTKNHRRRIVSYNMLSEYAYLLAPNSHLYTVTDVKELHDWHVEKCSSHPCFERVPDDEALANDPCTLMLFTETEEGKKVTRLGGKKFFAIFRRRLDHELPPPSVLSLFDSTSNTDSNMLSDA